VKILIISPQTWTNLYVSKQYYAIHLKKLGHEVFFLNPISSILKKKFFFFKIKKEKNFGLNIIDLNIFCPLFIKTFLNFLYRIFLKFSIKAFQYITKLKFDLVWSFDEENYETINYFDSKKKIIHIVDPIKNLKKFHESTNKIDLIVFISKLFKIKNKAKKNIIIPHGLNLYFLKQAKHKFYKDKKKLENICLYGNFISGRFDLEKIKNIIEKNNKLNFTFVGNSDANHPYKDFNSLNESLKIIQILRRKKNVKFIKKTKPADLPYLINQQDLFLTIPKKKYNVNAHKLLEIISTGKPMISSIFDFYKNNIDLIYFPKNQSSEEFQILFDKISKNYKKYFNKTLNLKRKKYALKFNYDHHIKKILNELY
tara:strand:+ start:42526 stop:43632 length:1107 start_codon:yes stop_codon:yes gene_type:complete